MTTFPLKAIQRANLPRAAAGALRTGCGRVQGGYSAPLQKQSGALVLLYLGGSRCKGFLLRYCSRRNTARRGLGRVMGAFWYMYHTSDRRSARNGPAVRTCNLVVSRFSLAGFRRVGLREDFKHFLSAAALLLIHQAPASAPLCTRPMRVSNLQPRAEYVCLTFFGHAQNCLSLGILVLLDK